MTRMGPGLYPAQPPRGIQQPDVHMSLHLLLDPSPDSSLTKSSVPESSWLGFTGPLRPGSGPTSMVQLNLSPETLWPQPLTVDRLQGQAHLISSGAGSSEPVFQWNHGCTSLAGSPVALWGSVAGTWCGSWPEVPMSEVTVSTLQGSEPSYQERLEQLQAVICNTMEKVGSLGGLFILLLLVWDWLLTSDPHFSPECAGWPGPAAGTCDRAGR